MVIIALDCFWNPGRPCSPVLATILTLAFPHGNIAFFSAKNFSIYAFLIFFSILLIKFLFYCIMLELYYVRIEDHRATSRKLVFLKTFLAESSSSAL